MGVFIDRYPIFVFDVRLRLIQGINKQTISKISVKTAVCDKITDPHKFDWVVIKQQLCRNFIEILHVITIVLQFECSIIYKCSLFWTWFHVNLYRLIWPFHSSSDPEEECFDSSSITMHTNMGSQSINLDSGVPEVVDIQYHHISNHLLNLNYYSKLTEMVCLCIDYRYIALQIH